MREVEELFMKVNDNYFEKVLKKKNKSLIFLGVIVILLVATGSYGGLIPVALIGLYGIYLFKIKPKKINKILQNGFKSKSPEILLDYYESIFKSTKTPDVDALLAYNKALVLSYFGDFDKAKIEMSKIDWESRIPYYQAINLSIMVLRNYLETNDYSEGLKLAKEMNRLGQMSTNIPGSKQAQEFCDTYIEIGELLTGNIQNSILDKLEEIFNNTQFSPKLLIAWCLGFTYNKKGMKEKSNQMLSFCKDVAPYCYVLQRIK